MLEGMLLADAPVDDSSLEHFARLKGLSWIRLAGTKVADAGMVHIMKWPKITEVDLSRTQVTSAGLLTLKDVRTLERLKIHDGQLSAEARAELVKARPNLEIEVVAGR